MGESDAQSVLNISLAGPMRIHDEADSEIIISSPMSKRLIAILLRSGNMRRSRLALQTMLWDNTAGDPGANLRQLVMQTRMRLKEHSVHLQASAGFIALTGCVDLTDHKSDQHCEFFEDSGFGNEELEDWLRLERGRFYELPVALAAPAPIKPASRQPTVGLFNPSQPDVGSRIGVVADWVSNLFRDVYTGSEFIDFYDMRNQRGPDCDMNVEISVAPVGAAYELSVAAIVGGRCYWSQSQLVPSGKELQAHRTAILEFAQSSVCAVERCISRLEGYPELSWKNAPLYEIVSRLFSLAPEEVQGGVAALEAYDSGENPASILAWRGFAKMVQNGERLVSNRGHVVSEAEEFILKALEMDPTHPTTLTVAAHYYAYVVRDFERAYELSEEALKFAPYSPFARDVRATLDIYTGDLSMAAHHAEIACRLGRYGPMRHYLAGTEVMLHTLLGAHEKAVRAGEVLLQARPRFMPVLRHMSASLAALDRVDQAHGLVQQVRQLDPEFATSAMKDTNYAMPSSLSRTKIYSVLRQKGLHK